MRVVICGGGVIGACTAYFLSRRAELIADGVAVSTDLTPFDPVRLRPLDPSLLSAR